MPQLGHLNRYWQIACALLRHGVPYLLHRRSEELPRCLRSIMEDLGPTFVKLGQLLSTRPDLVPLEWAKELARLQDKVEPFPPEKVREQIRFYFGAPPEEVFASFDYQPVAAASIAQVHRARLPDGHEVAVKIQRPGLRKLVEQDLSILRAWLPVLHQSFLGRILNPEEVVQVFARQIGHELDFYREAVTMAAFRRILTLEEVVVPRVYWDYCRQGVLTMDFIEGARINDENALAGLGADRRYLARLVLKAVLVPFFRDGFFHADPHPGNVLFLPGPQVALLDFGIVGRLDRDFRYETARLMVALARRDVERLLEITLSLGVPTRPINRDRLYEDMAHLMEKVNSLGPAITMAQLVNGMVEVSLEHGLRMPGAFFTLGKAVVTAEGLARRLDPDLNIMEVAAPAALDFLGEEVRPHFEGEKVYVGAAEAWRAFSRLPWNVARVIENLAEGRQSTVFIHRGLESLYRMLDVASRRLACGLVLAAGMAGSALILHAGLGPNWAGFSLVGLLGFVMSGLFAFWLVAGMMSGGPLGSGGKRGNGGE